MKEDIEMEEYEIKLRLTETEAEQLVKAAAQHDQKVSELLESFVYDLVSSDEHVEEMRRRKQHNSVSAMQ